MINMTDAEKEAWASGNQKFLHLVFDDGTEIDNSLIAQESMSIEETLSDENNLVYGKCSASVFKIRLLDTEMSYKGKRITVSIDVDEYTKQLGVYTIEDDARDSSKKYKDIVAYDDMYRIANTNVAEWYNGLTFPISFKDFRDSFFAYFEIMQDVTILPLDDMMLDKNIDAEVISGLDVIQSICQLNACFGHINSFGNFEYIQLIKPNVFTDDNTFYPSEYSMNGLNYQDYETEQITKVIIRNTSSDVGGEYGVDGNTYVIEGNILALNKSVEELEQIAQSILNVISTNVYQPSSLSIKYQPYLELGDYIKVVGINGEEVTSPILHRSISGITALKDVYEAKGEKTYGEQVNSLSKTISELNGKYSKLSQTVDELSMEIGKVSTPNVGGKNLILFSKTLGKGHELLTEYLEYQNQILTYQKSKLYI